MKRKVFDQFDYWKTHHHSKPLMVLGARQVGKTYALNQFCKKNYQHYVYINLESDEPIYRLFDQTINPVELIESISIIKNVDIPVQDSVIFIDEIQSSERAIQSLKYFAETTGICDIVCAGSVLGVAINRMRTSFPVGKVYRRSMYSMDFEEFLWAIGEDRLVEKIASCFQTNRTMVDPLHQKALDLYKIYLYIGGMPASIRNYLDMEKQLNKYDETVLDSILEDYIADMNKYTTNSEFTKISKIYRSLPQQLGRENNKFNYKLVDVSGNKRYFESGLDWLEHSYIAQRCTLTEYPKVPLSAYQKSSQFKIYTHDVGILARLAGFTKTDLYSEEINLYSGMLTENYVANTLKTKGFELYFWKSKNSAELDFVVNIDGHIIPIEVKAAQNTKSKSLSVYIEKYQPKYAIKISSKNFGFVDGIKSVPLYAAFLISSK